MTYRQFSITMEVDVDFRIDERHLEMLMSEEWQKSYYRFEDEDEALAYLARLIAAYGRVDGLDGHANLPDDWLETVGDHKNWNLAWGTEIPR